MKPCWVLWWTIGFNDNKHSYICSICWLDVSSFLFSICRLNQVKNTNESMMLKMFYLYGFVRWTNYIWWAIDNNYICSFISFLSLQLNEFLQPEIKQTLSSFQKITCITAIAEEYFAAYVSLLFKLIVSSALPIFPWNP